MFTPCDHREWVPHIIRGVKELARQKQQMALQVDLRGSERRGEGVPLAKGQRQADHGCHGLSSEVIRRISQGRGRASTGGRPRHPLYSFTFSSFSPLPPLPQCRPWPCAASPYPEPLGAGWTVTQGGVWGSLLFPGSEPEQHCLFPPGQSVEGAAEGRATGEFPHGQQGECRGGGMEQDRGGQETTGEARLG